MYKTLVPFSIAMRVILFGLIILTFLTAGSAQSPKKLIFWSGDANCGFKSRAVTARETIKCEQITTDRGPVSAISYEGITLAAAFLDDEDKIIVGARITNATDEVVGFDSDLWGAAHFKTKAGFYAGEKPIEAETSLPTREMLRSIAYGGRVTNSVGEFIADHQMTTESRRIRRLDGTEYTVTKIIPDKDAKETEARQQVSRNESLTKEQQRIRDNALTSKFVSPHGFVVGLVYFRLVKKAEFVVYSLSVGDTTFVFQLPREKK